jgi:2-oxoglutarate dehydrogenase E1 component
MSNKTSSDLHALRRTGYLFGSNAAFIEDLYRRFRRDPTSVDRRWREWFASLGEPVTETPPAARRGGEAIAQAVAPLAPEAAQKQAAVLRLINAYRFRGHQNARIDPLGLQSQPALHDLDPHFHGLTEADMDTVFNVGSLRGPDRMPLRAILELVRSVYCGPIGAEYMHITSTQQKRWLQNRIEGPRLDPDLSTQQKRRILNRLIAAEGLERYLHTRYVGQKRFSLEGAESLIPALDEIIQRAGDRGVRQAVIGMAHRGRLNVLVNILGKSPRELYSEFEGKYDPGTSARSGDVKYHQGFSSDIETPGGTLHLALAFNPSHLEIVNPVVEGSVRARMVRLGDQTGARVLPLLIHGDAAFAGQGVVMETLNMSQAQGFKTGGTVHVIVNNQIGFTTSDPLDARSTHYCTDVAKMVQAPILHVNADDPEAVIFAARIALDFRMEFRKDVVLDLVCYRRQGHNEADEPAVTQPLMYEGIKSHPTPKATYAGMLVDQGAIPAKEVVASEKRYREALDAGEVVAFGVRSDAINELAVDWSPYRGTSWDHLTDTRVPQDRLQELAERQLRLPEGFTLHPRVGKILEARRKMASSVLSADWGFAETLAYATLLADGYQIRLTGQDTERGTFFHRHSVLHCQKDGAEYTPLANLLPDQPLFTVINSLLSEEAVLGFEYGYATADPKALVIWEAQFGDFANGAQVVIDQFISSGEAKWGRLCGLTLFLPHGFEGQGPEHSSARLERFLQLSAEHNIQVCVPTTPAQFYHMLRRQALRPYRRPLIVMTPKSLLRHKLSVSSLEDLAQGRYEPVIDDVEGPRVSKVKRVVLCSGKIYFDLVEERHKRGLDGVALVRIEQLYPFPTEALSQVLNRYNHAKELVWCQEEPQNQGAWYPIQHHLRACKRPRQELVYAGRAMAAAPAAGYLALHLEQQRRLVTEALGKPQSEEAQGPSVAVPQT